MSVRPGFVFGRGVVLLLAAAGRFAAGLDWAGLDVALSDSTRVGVVASVGGPAGSVVFELTPVSFAALVSVLIFVSRTASVDAAGTADGTASIEGAGDGDGSTTAAPA